MDNHKPFLNAKTVVENEAMRRFSSIKTNNLHLVSQIQRSGGSLLIQLLDSHNEILTHPSELHIGKPSKYYWPELKPSLTPKEYFIFLHEKRLFEYAKYGYEKNLLDKNDRLPFVYVPETHCNIFIQKCRKLPLDSDNFSQREIINLYFRSFFASWIDHDLGSSKIVKKPVISHVARLIKFNKEIAKFKNDFPKGKIISVIRDPLTWYSSAKKFNQEYSDMNHAMELWRDCVEAAAQLNYEDGAKTKLIKFSSLLREPKETLDVITSFLKISPINKIVPTFNGKLIASNSSFKNVKGTISDDPLMNTSALNDLEIQFIKSKYLPIYNDVLNVE